jgi:hypothetical protein
MYSKYFQIFYATPGTLWQSLSLNSRPLFATNQYSFLLSFVTKLIIVLASQTILFFFEQLSFKSLPSETSRSRCKETHLSFEVMFVCFFHARFGSNQKNSLIEHHSNFPPHVVSFAAVHMTLSPTVDSVYIHSMNSSANIFVLVYHL